MSCDDCENAQLAGKVYYFRWKNANVGVMGCETHIREIFDVLRGAQDGR